MNLKWRHSLNFIAGAFLTGIFLFVFSAAANAACTGPSGDAGAIFYNQTHKVAQYCNDTDWIAMNKPGSGSGGCTNPNIVEGAIVYSETLDAPIVCAGSTWQLAAPPSSGGVWQELGENGRCAIKKMVVPGAGAPALARNRWVVKHTEPFGMTGPKLCLVDITRLAAFGPIKRFGVRV